MSLFKKLMLCACVVALAPSSAVAEDFGLLYRRLATAYFNTEYTAVVAFHSKKPIEATIEKASEAMFVENPNGTFYKTWVNKILDKGYDEKTGCGVIIGQLRFEYNRKEWEDAFIRKSSRFIDAISIAYVRGDHLVSIPDTAGDRDAVEEACDK